MKLSGLTKMVKRQLVCNVFHNDESDDFYIGTASAIYCATGFPRPLNRNQMGAMLGISEDTRFTTTSTVHTKLILRVSILTTQLRMKSK